MATAPFPYVDIPEEVSSVVGKRVEGTRIYEREGSEEEAGYWFEAMDDIIGRAVSPGGVSMFCPITRAAVHKRVKEGRLSAFYFYTKEIKTNWFGKKRVHRESPYILIPVTEAKAWKQELEKEAMRRGYVSQDDLDGNEPEWVKGFLEWKKRRDK